MRLIKALFALVFIAFGVLFGALNRQAVRIELGFTGFDGTVGTVPSGRCFGFTPPSKWRSIG